MDVENYRTTRYKGIDQQIVNKRETKILEKILVSLSDRSVSILDVPCGYGRFSELLLRNSLNLTSADISLPMVMAARKYSLPSSSNHHFLVGDIRNLPLKDNTFDYVITIRLLQHMLNASIRRQVLRELHRVAKKMVILSFYRYNFLHSIERWIRCQIKNVDKRISMLSLNDFSKELNSTGFVVLRLFPVLKYFHAHTIALLQKAEV